jgi:hypothetical protein
MVTSVAFSVDQVRIEDWPRWIVCGLAVNEALGAGGGGGGGVGDAFLLQALCITSTARTVAIAVRLSVQCFQGSFVRFMPFLPHPDTSKLDSATCIGCEAVWTIMSFRAVIENDLKLQRKRKHWLVPFLSPQADF